VLGLLEEPPQERMERKMNDNDTFAQLSEEFKRGGWIMAIMGGIGMLVRLILTNEEYSFLIWFRKVIAGTFVGLICYFSLYGSGIEEIYKSVVCSIAGSIAPELFEKLRVNIIKKIFK